MGHSKRLPVGGNPIVKKPSLFLRRVTKKALRKEGSRDVWVEKIESCSGEPRGYEALYSTRAEPLTREAPLFFHVVVVLIVHAEAASSA